MKIKIINLKNLSAYFSKILILVAVVLIFGKFFCNIRNVNSSFKFDSAFFSKIINREIALLNNRSGNDDKSTKSLYSQNTINTEIGIVKLAMNQNSYKMDSNLSDDATISNEQAIDANSAEMAQYNEENPTNLVNSANHTEDILEPAVRTKH